MHATGTHADHGLRTAPFSIPRPMLQPTNGKEHHACRRRMQWLRTDRRETAVLSMEEMSDRFEIQDLLVGYCYAVDNKDFAALDQFFTDDAVIDYSEMVGIKGAKG